MRILLADADQEIGNFLRRGLLSEGLVVEAACSSEGALALLGEKKQYSAALLDVNLPGVGFFQVLKEVKRHFIPALAMGADHHNYNFCSVLNDGAADYIIKPLRLIDVVVRLRVALNKQSNSPDSKTTLLRGKTLALNLVRRELKCNNKQVILTKLEFDLLEYFMRRPGEVISPSILWQHLKDGDSYQPTNLFNIIQVHILNLRRKIDRPRRESLIRTVRGCGYAFDA